MGEILKNAEFDEYGLLKDPDTWSIELASQLAKEHGIGSLTEQHWAFIQSLRNYYQRFRVPPPTERICHALNLAPGSGHRLFHNCLEAWQIAGLPDPGEEAKSYLSAE